MYTLPPTSQYSVDPQLSASMGTISHPDGSGRGYLQGQWRPGCQPGSRQVAPVAAADS